MSNITARLTCLLFLLITASATAQDAQQLGGEYLGLASLGVGTTPFDLSLGIEEQLNRRFVGVITKELDTFSIEGTIAASDKCAIQVDSADLTTFKLDWANLSGAGVLTGVVINHEEQLTGPVSFLRPFEDRDVNWGDGIVDAVFRSDVTGARFGVPIDFRSQHSGGANFSKGLFAASFMFGGESFEIVGTSSTRLEVAAAGVGSSSVATIVGQLNFGDHNSLQAGYAIQTPSGKLLDAGTLSILDVPIAVTLVP